MIIKIMADRCGFNEAIQEVKEQWLKDLLLFLSIDIQIIHEYGSSEFVHYLFNNKIEIIEYAGMGALQVKYENEIVGEWGAPILKLKRDDNGGLYFEINVECWSIIEENINTT